MAMPADPIFHRWRPARGLAARPQHFKEAFMPIEKSKTPTDSKQQRDQSKVSQSSELNEDDLRSVTGGVASTGGVTSLGASVCVSQT